MKKVLIGICIGLVLGLAGGYAISASSQKQSQPIASTKVTEPTRAELLKLVNEQRAKVGVTPLKEDLRLDESAQYKSSDMAQRNYFSHFDPVTGKDSHDIIFATGIKCIDSSENIHWATNSTISSAETVGGWHNSPPHYKAMVNPKYSLTGFGIATSNGKTYVTEHFCQQ